MGGGSRGKTNASSNRPCCKSNAQKSPLCCPPCLSLLESHDASINQVGALSRGSERDCEHCWSPTGHEEDGSRHERRKRRMWDGGLKVRRDKAVDYKGGFIPLHPSFANSSSPSPVLFPLTNSTACPFLNTRNFEKESAVPAVPWSLL